MQYQGRNYLMPVDAELEDEISVRYQMIAIDDVRAALDRAPGVRIMILDACRNNPLAEQFAQNMTGQHRSIGSVRGLARIDKTQGMVVAYSTAADEVAMDGQGRNSPYTVALLKRLQEPGLEIEMMFRRIAADVNAQTNGKQRPETYVSLLNEYYLNQADRTAWNAVKDSSDPAALRGFITRFPSSPLLGQAEARLQLVERTGFERPVAERRRRRKQRRRKQRPETMRTNSAASSPTPSNRSCKTRPPSASAGRRQSNRPKSAAGAAAGASPAAGSSRGRATGTA